MLSRFFPSEKTDPELAPYRAGLVFGFFNALTWQIGINTPMVLFAEQLGATPFQVGLAYAFVFVLTPVQVVSTALLPRYGFKRVMLGGWGTRSVFLSVPLMLAAVVGPWGVQPWMASALVASVFFFCLFRSVGAAAITPWLYSILPPGARGRYFAGDQFFSGIAGVGTLIGCVALFAWLPIYTALFIQYVIALTGSTLSYFALKRLPDAPKPVAISLATVAQDTPRHLFAPSPFRRYLWMAVGYFLLSTPIPPFSAYYLKVVPQLGAGHIMLFEVVRYSGVICAAWAIGKRIDRVGARPFMLFSLGCYVAVCGYWWWFLQAGTAGLAGFYAAYFLLGVGATAWTVANLNFLPKVTPESERTLMVSIHGAGTSFLGGCAPIIWGLFLKTEGESGAAIDVGVFKLFFITALVGALVLAWAVVRLAEPRGGGPGVGSLQLGGALLRPLRAMTYLINLVDPPNAPGSAKPDDPGARGGKG